MSYADLNELLDRYGWEPDGSTTEQNRLQYTLTPVKKRRSISKRGSWHEWQGGNSRWRLPGTDLRCSVSSTDMVQIYELGYNPPQFLHRIKIDEIDSVEAALRYLHPRENVPILSGDEWYEMMATIVKHAKDSEEVQRIITLLGKRDWWTFLQAYNEANKEDEGESAVS